MVLDFGAKKIQYLICSQNACVIIIRDELTLIRLDIVFGKMLRQIHAVMQ